MNKTRVLPAALLAALALGIVAPAAVAAMADRFLIQVAAVIAATSDESEPVRCDEVAATAQEDTEPAAP